MKINKKMKRRERIRNTLIIIFLIFIIYVSKLELTEAQDWILLIIFFMFLTLIVMDEKNENKIKLERTHKFYFLGLIHTLQIFSLDYKQQTEIYPLGELNLFVGELINGLKVYSWEETRKIMKKRKLVPDSFFDRLNDIIRIINEIEEKKHLKFHHLARSRLWMEIRDISRKMLMSINIDNIELLDYSWDKIESYNWDGLKKQEQK